MLIALSDALDIISRIQVQCMMRGYYIALAGGVLNRGYSSNDLDLIAVPRSSASNPNNLIEYISEVFTLDSQPTINSRGRTIDIYHYTYRLMSIDVAVIRLETDGNAS